MTNSDILSRCFINEHEAILDGKDSKIERETKYLEGIKQSISQTLGYNDVESVEGFG